MYTSPCVIQEPCSMLRQLAHCQVNMLYLWLSSWTDSSFLFHCAAGSGRCLAVKPIDGAHQSLKVSPLKPVHPSRMK